MIARTRSTVFSPFIMPAADSADVKLMRRPGEQLSAVEEDFPID